ncbi:uncharacterized protein FIBRA_06853 [Fibroporia radiculosa]|uniref:Uncharacterized protein n=1 Tax=Fibroporia radiculosa TaxID=599839 RepID=J4HZR6_9APHY|nr:uncharacterized protein FIBRA_06853 [Fibroporia radiculosa]CCM04667.1 predicted protein [Fibroporia radiculosa]
MVNAALPDGIYLRSSLNTGLVDQVNSLAAFSPDIIPLSHTNAKPATLAAAHEHFLAHAVDPAEPRTAIYVRGRSAVATGHGCLRHTVGLRAVPSELVLWPQAWEAAAPLGTVELKAGMDGKFVASAAYVSYTPAQGLGRADAFVATSGRTPTNLSARVKTWRDLVRLVGQEPSVATYNCTFADPVAPDVSVATRFRMLDNARGESVSMVFAIEAVGTPKDDIEIAFSCAGATPNAKPFSFAQQRVSLSPTALVQTKVEVPANFDGMLTLHITNERKRVFADNSSVSIVAYAIDGKDNYVLLGAQHVVFHSNMRVKRLVKRYEARRAAAVHPSPASNGSDPFYFRESVQDVDSFPRNENASHSCDIQPLGQQALPNINSVLGGSNYFVDVSDQRAITLYQNMSNYVYLRGTTTEGTSGNTRLFAIPSGLLLHPSLYEQYSIMDYDENGDPTGPEILPYNTSSAEQPVVIQKPFNCVNLPPLPAGSDHFCLIAECKYDGVDPSTGDNYQWPHEETGEFVTSGEFVSWVLSNPCVSWRNICYATSPSAATQVMRSSLTIPSGFSSTDNWQIQVNCVNCPSGSAFSMDSDDPEISYGKTIITGSDAAGGPEFTGKSPGYNCQLAISWYANGMSMQGGQRIEAQLAYLTYDTGVVANTFRKAGKPAGAVTLKVGEEYPNAFDAKGTPLNARGLPRLGGAWTRRALGGKYTVEAGILIKHIIGVDAMGYQLS